MRGQRLKTTHSWVHTCLAGAGALLVSLVTAVAPLQAQGGSYKVMKYQPALSGYAGQVEFIGRPKDSHDEAEKVCAAWSKQNPDSFKIPFVKEYEETITPPRPPAPRPPEPDLRNPIRPGGPGAPPPPTKLEGGSWIGSETLQGYGRLEFRFLGGNRVQMVDARDSVNGTVSRYGETVILNFYNGQCTYYGTVTATGIAGHAVAGKTRFNWSVSR